MKTLADIRADYQRHNKALTEAQEWIERLTWRRKQLRLLNKIAAKEHVLRVRYEYEIPKADRRYGDSSMRTEIFHVQTGVLVQQMIDAVREAERALTMLGVIVPAETSAAGA